MTSKFFKINKLKIILTVIFFALGVYGTFSFALFTSFGWDTTITDTLLAGSFVDTVLQLLSVGGIVGLILGNFLASFTPIIVLIIIIGILQLLWSYVLSYLVVLIGRKLFPK